MERLILSHQTEIFLGKRDFLKGRLKLSKFSNGISEWKMCVPFASFSSSRPFCVDRLPFEKKVVEMKRAYPRENFHFGH